MKKKYLIGIIAGIALVALAILITLLVIIWRRTPDNKDL